MSDFTDEEIWDVVKQVREAVGISDSNYRRMRSDKILPSKWVAPVFLHIEGTPHEIPLKRLYELSQ